MTDIPGLQDHRTLRYVEIDGGYRLHTWDTYDVDRLGKSWIGYAFYRPNATEPLFVSSVGCSPLHAIDSDDVLRSIMGWVTLRRGDTDKEYFHDYTEDQWAFSDGEAEELQHWGFSEDSCKQYEMRPPVFRDVEMN